MAFRTVLPLPAFVLHPLTAVVVAAVHVYLAFGHLSALLGGDIQWTHIWKGFGALAAPTCSRHWLRARSPETEISGQGWNVQVQITPVIPKLIKGVLFQ